MEVVQQSGAELQLKFRAAAVILNVIVLCIAALAILGWQFNIEIFKRPLTEGAAMNPLTAVLFVLTSIAFH